MLVGRNLGANLALDVAAAHPELAGVVLVSPLDDPVSAIFNDSRARVVPAHWLVRDRWDAGTSAQNLLIPSLWFYWTQARADEPKEDQPPAYEVAKSRKSLVWLTDSPESANDFHNALARWLDDLAVNRKAQ